LSFESVAMTANGCCREFSAFSGFCWRLHH
jgi:hypothetical protein